MGFYTPSQTSIANRALQMLGYKSIGSINDLDRGARAINRAYYPVLEAALRDNHWNFSIKRVRLPADATAPLFGKNYQYTLPGDFIDLANKDDIYGAVTNVSTSPQAPLTDWKIEGGKILTNDQSPIDVRYVSSGITEGQFDPLFAEAFAAQLALSVCEELTQSNTKLQNCANFYDQAMSKAKQRNAYENRPVQAPMTSWITSRF